MEHEKQVLTEANNKLMQIIEKQEKDIDKLNKQLKTEIMLNKLSKEIYEQNKAKGFWEKERNVGELLMLITSELAEALEADRDGLRIEPEMIEYLDEIQRVIEIEVDKETKEELKESWVSVFRSSAKETFEMEIADALIRILDLCGGLGINIEWLVANKLRYNKTRGIKHGRNY